MKMIIKKSLIIFFLLNFNSNVIADIAHYLDFKYILNESVAGKKAQDHGMKTLEVEIQGPGSGRE